MTVLLKLSPKTSPKIPAFEIKSSRQWTQHCHIPRGKSLGQFYFPSSPPNHFFPHRPTSSKFYISISGEQWAAAAGLTIISRTCLQNPLFFRLPGKLRQHSLGSFIASSMLISPSCCSVPSFNKHTLIVSWTCVVKSLLHKVKNPHSTNWPWVQQLRARPRSSNLSITL